MYTSSAGFSKVLDLFIQFTSMIHICIASVACLFHYKDSLLQKMQKCVGKKNTDTNSTSEIIQPRVTSGTPCWIQFPCAVPGHPTQITQGQVLTGILLDGLAPCSIPICQFVNKDPVMVSCNHIQKHNSIILSTYTQCIVIFFARHFSDVAS